MLVSLLKQNIVLDDYKKNHPAGNIGKNLKKINTSKWLKMKKHEQDQLLK